MGCATSKESPNVPPTTVPPSNAHISENTGYEYLCNNSINDIIKLIGEPDGTITPDEMPGLRVGVNKNSNIYKCDKIIIYKSRNIYILFRDGISIDIYKINY